MDVFEKVVQEFKEFESSQNKRNCSYLSSNIVYHYTKLNTLLEYILPELRLRLQSKKLTNDPFENQNLYLSLGGYVPTDGGTRAKALIESIERKINKEIRIISFCMNNSNENGKEYFGYSKPRMWAQHGDDFKGVCIAINLEKLIRQNSLSGNSQIFMDKISYQRIEDRWKNKTRIDYSEFNNSNNDSTIIKEILDRKIKEIVFTKHLDFRDENEFRICHITHDEFSYLDISNSIHGIIINSQKMSENEKHLVDLFSYAEKCNFLITENDWSNNDLHNWHNKMSKKV